MAPALGTKLAMHHNYWWCLRPYLMMAQTEFSQTLLNTAWGLGDPCRSPAAWNLSDTVPSACKPVRVVTHDLERPWPLMPSWPDKCGALSSVVSCADLILNQGILTMPHGVTPMIYVGLLPSTQSSRTPRNTVRWKYIEFHLLLTITITQKSELYYREDTDISGGQVL